MKRLIRFLKGYEKESFLAPLFKMLEATFELIVPLVVARIMDIGIKNQDNVYIWHQCVHSIFLQRQPWDSALPFARSFFPISADFLTENWICLELLPL